MENKKIKCMLCGRSLMNEIDYVVPGADPNIGICYDCIGTCVEMIKKDSLNMPYREENDFELLKPHEIKEKLDEYIVGQDKAKKVLSVAVYNHYKRINYKSDDVELDKSNILMLGPTGSGKTLLAKTLAKILNVPFAVADATTLTEAGYVGEDVENVLLKLIQAADYDIEKAQLGIIYIDEIDKLASKGENMSITRDVSGEGVQQALLKIIESTVASVPPQGGRKHPQQECLTIDTTNILFICGGAFVGLDKIIDKRLDGSGLGFGAKVRENNKVGYGELIGDIKPDDLIKYGLIPEFVGRIPIVVGLDALDEDALVNILTQPKNAPIRQYKKLFELDGVDIEFDANALRAIAKQAIKLNTGARGLRSVLENLMLELMYDIPTDKAIKKIVITEDVVSGGKRPLIEREKSREKSA